MDLPAYFAAVADFRVQGRCLHLLSDILALIVVGTLADCSDYDEIADYGADKIAFLRTELGLVLANGIPSSDTLERVMRWRRTDTLDATLRAATQALVDYVQTRQVCVDGKELRGTIPPGGKHAQQQLVSAWSVEQGLCLGQVPVGDKSGEATAVPTLLAQLDYREAVVSLDAAGCHKAIAAQILAGGGDYLLALKGNQRTLHAQVEAYWDRCSPQATPWVSRELGHGRAEQRTVYVTRDFALVEEAETWPTLRSLVLVETRRWQGERETTSRRYYISSLADLTPPRAAALVRQHWAIENQLHWQLDVTFGEDDARVRAGQGAVNLNLVRKFCLALLTREPTARSLKRKRKKAARDNAFLLQLLKAPHLVR